MQLKQIMVILLGLGCRHKSDDLNTRLYRDFFEYIDILLLIIWRQSQYDIMELFNKYG